MRHRGESHSFSLSQAVRKPVGVTATGVVAAQHRRAAEIGAAILREGGDAVDAAIAVSYAIGVLEPWMSGPGGGGAMIIWRAGCEASYALNFGMRAPAALDPNDYALAPEGKASDLFPWKAVVDDRNVQGATAIAVPGTVAGTREAHARFGRMPWTDLLQPAVAIAREGLKVDWYASLLIASAAKDLSKDRDAAAVFLEEGQWPKSFGWTAISDVLIDQSHMAATLSRLAEAGADDFYTGELARMIVADVQEKGGVLALNDLAGYRAEWQAPLTFKYRAARIYTTPFLTGGPSLRDALVELEEAMTPGARPDPMTYVAYANALRSAYTRRLAGMGDGESPQAPACTTHFSVVDRQGNMVAMTQTLLSMFGSRIVSPSTGLLMNNGIMWFDPEPGHPNSLAPAKRCLMNICPTIVEAEGRRAAIGASGGRKIMPAVMQITSFLSDFGMSLEEAFHQPRIDASGGDCVIADEALDPEILSALSKRFPLVSTPRTVLPYAFACPAAVMEERGRRMGCTEIMSPWGDAIHEEPI
ncbi:gamma-glutamyltransferase [Mesorhizobium sp.]|uniref:gamma-glutamyltransferase family protein n=1 Tax=Mesorhizobium sp. TaxID=1871066 RepID=UPI000FE42889|nr:gamma-glutamyltransferase [Mesorhizobium sp.]RWQ12603.1 MAG: gamma-glutamyltransferase [Mesorhizobium sp.]